MVVKVVRRVSMNKNTKQLSVTIPKREMKKIDPDLKFSDDLFVELKVLKRRKK